METKINEKELEEKYARLSDAELKQEFNDIRAIPNARTNIEALTRMATLIPEMEKRGIMESQPSRNANASNQTKAGVSWGGVILGLALIIGGIALSSGTGRIFYGAIIVGIGILIKSFF